MNTTKRSGSNGFGLQRDITSDGAVLFLRVTNARRLDLGLLDSILSRYLRGGYQLLTLDQGQGVVRTIALSEFVQMVRNLADESRLLFLERRLI